MLLLHRRLGSLIAISLVVVMALAAGCSDLIRITDDSALASPVKPVKLSVMVTPQGTGFVGIDLLRTLSSGQTAELNLNDQAYLMAMTFPHHSQEYRFDHWEGDIDSRYPQEFLLMDSPKTVRAVFVKRDEGTAEDVRYYQLRLNGQVIRSYTLGLDNGSVQVDPAPGEGDFPYPEGTDVTLRAMPDHGYQAGKWKGDCGSHGECVVKMNGDRDVDVTFDPLATITPTSDGKGS